MTTPSLASNNDNHNDEFTRAIPDPSLYEYYTKMKGRIRDSTMAKWNGSLNPDCVLISLGYTQGYLEAHYLDEDNDPWGDEQEQELAQKLVDAYGRIYEADENSNSKWHMISTDVYLMDHLFNVDYSIFSYRHDRQCEIREGYLYDAYMVSALRSFAWTLADYCERKGVTPSDVSYPELRRLVDFIAAHDWLNYDNVSRCKGLCDAPDSGVFYIPDGLSEYDLSLVPGTQTKLDLDSFVVNDLLRSTAIFRPLNDLRSDLAFVYPAIQLLFKELAINRNYLEHLTGDDADLVYAWCVFANGAKSPFSLEREPGYTNVLFERRKDNRDIWFEMHGKKVTKNPAIEFRNKRFFFCDLDEPYSVREHPTVQAVIKHGGILQGGVTSLTDYLVVNPPPPHRYYGPPEIALPAPVSARWIDVACSYRRSGRHIDIVFQKDVEAVLEEYVLPAPPLLPPRDVEVVRYGNDCSGQLVDQGTQRFAQVQAVYVQKAKLVPATDLVIDEYGTLVKYKGSEKHIILPEGIKAIGKDAFWDHWFLESIILPEGIQEIGNAAFYGRHNLRHITLPSTLRSIGEKAFSCCTNLTKIVFPEGLERIGQEAFSGCRNLEEIKLPSTLRTVPWRSFQYCDALRHIDIPEGIETIGGYAFKDCYSIREMRLPSTLRAISKCSFQGCHALTHVDLPEGIDTIGDYAFMDCYSIKEIKLPSTLRVISKCSFQGCHGLTHIDMPVGIKTIGDYAFMDCYSLAEIQLPSTLQKICYRSFCKCSALKSIAIPEGVRSISASAFELCEQLNSVVFSSGTVPDVPFTFRDNVSSAKLRRRLQRIGKEAFKFCYSLVEIDIPKGITSIEPMAFEGCVNLAKVTLPSTLRTIGARAFFDCQALESLVIPDGVKEIGDSAFEGCQKLEDVRLPASVKTIGENAFTSR